MIVEAKRLAKQEEKVLKKLILNKCFKDYR